MAQAQPGNQERRAGLLDRPDEDVRLWLAAIVDSSNDAIISKNLKAVGGQLAVLSEPQHGTTILASVPVVNEETKTRAVR